MTDRERLATTLGILLAGLFEAEDAEASSERRPRVRVESGVFPRSELESLLREDPHESDGNRR